MQRAQASSIDSASRHVRRLPAAGAKLAGKGHFIFICALAVLLPAVCARGQEQTCADCHGDPPKDKAKTVRLADNSVHAGIECAECHVGLKTPHSQKVRPVRCSLCHRDQMKALGQSSHGKQLRAHFQKRGKKRISTICLACHGGDPHAIRSRKHKLSATNRANIDRVCFSCHLRVQPINIASYKRSVHAATIARDRPGGAICTDCHGSHRIDHSSLPASKVFPRRIPETCGSCHVDDYKEYVVSQHWIRAQQGFRESPVCTDCHGEHGIRGRADPLSPVFAGNVARTCAHCHASERLTSKYKISARPVGSYRRTFHGLSGALGDLRVANCASCHGNHAILPSSDPRSTIHPDNLGKTCGTCHTGAKERFINGPIHTTQQHPSHWVVGLVPEIYVWVIVLSVAGMLLHNLLDLYTKAVRGAPYTRAQALDPRFTLGERVQHGVLALCFVLLALTGFALQFPESLFAEPFHWFSGGVAFRRWLHRACALVFVLLGVYHVLYLLLTPRGRTQFKLLRPCWQDVKDAIAVTRGYLRERREKTALPHYGYVEKFEYWALVWGSIVMTVTGLSLYFIDVTLSKLPLWAADLALTIHFWEAVLATLAILVWHGYWVFFDPEHYPMNLTWLIGNARPRKTEEETCNEPGLAPQSSAAAVNEKPGRSPPAGDPCAEAARPNADANGSGVVQRERP